MKHIVGMPIADSLHPVANPAVDHEGNVYTTFSGSRGQKSPVSIYKVDASYTRPFVTDLMNATGLAFDRDGLLYVSSRLTVSSTRSHRPATCPCTSRAWG